MSVRDLRRAERPPPRLQPRAVVFGVLLLLFGLGMLIAGLSIGMTTAGLPPERHPCLLLEKDDLGQIRARLEKRPYRQWHSRLERSLEDPEADFLVTPNGESRNAQRAKALAFAFVLSGEREYADRAAEALRKARSPSRGGRWRGLDDIVEGAAAYALAYDLLAGYLRSHEVLEAKTRLLLYELGRELHTSRYMWPSPGGDTRAIRQFSALGLCALAISDYSVAGKRPQMGEWRHRAKRETLNALRHQVCRDGAYAEGPGRHLAAARLYLPFLIANLHVTGEDLLTDQALQACEWSIRIRMPNGLRPNIDSSALTPTCSYALAGAPAEASAFRWDAETADLVNDIPDEQLPEAIAWYDSDAPIRLPEWPASEVLEASGDIILRSGWERDSTYLLLRAEHSKARTAGGVYEQPDATSILLCRGEETLVLDSGYGGWRERQGTREGPSHSMVLIDGKGPPIETALGAILSVGVDVETTDAVFSEKADGVRVRRQHDGATFERTVIFVDKRHFIIFDRAWAEEGKHDYTWQLHVNAGGDTDGELEVSGNTARVQRPGAVLRVVLHSSNPGASRLSQTICAHYFRAGEPQKHAVLRATARGCAGADFVAVLSPLTAAGPFETVTTRDGEGWLGVSLGDKIGVVFRRAGTRALRSGPFVTDGFALCWSRDCAGHPRYAVAMGASRLWVDKKLIWRRRSRASVVWQPEAAKTRAAGASVW